MISARLLMIVALVALPTASAPAEEIQLGIAPSNPGKAGFTVTILTERLGNEGFQPVKLRFRAIGSAFTAQRQLTLLFRPRTQYRTNIDFQFSCDVTVPQGGKTYETDVLVPHFYRWESCSVRILEDGRAWGKAATMLGIPSNVKDWGQHVSIGLIRPRATSTTGAAWETFPDVRSILTVLGDGPLDAQADVPRLDDKQSLALIDRAQSGWTRFRILDEDALQTSWIGYSQLDLILVPFPVLARIVAEQPEQNAALQRWVSTGGQIWTYAAPTDPAQIAAGWLSGKREAFDKAVHFASTPKTSLSLGEVNNTSPVEYQPWNYGSYSSNTYAYDSTNSLRQDIYDKMVEAENPMVATETRKQMESRVGVMPYGIGRVVFITDQDPFPGSFQLWKSLESSRQHWDRRQGVDFANGNDSYWAWLMAAVGQPPVTVFVVLNALFVLVMGPVLYFGLRRRSRLYLLYFLAPALAFLATLGLFSYAFLSDGFSNRVRLRQLTWFDGRNAEPGTAVGETGPVPIVDQSRQTYYTVVDSDRGLRFDDQSLVLPVLHTEIMDQYSYRMADHSRPGDYSIHQAGNQRVYSEEFLPTRTQVHYLVTRPSLGTLPIRVDLESEPPTLTNRMDVTLREVTVVDKDGRYWKATAVAAGETAALASSDVSQFARLVAQSIEPDTASMPEPFQNRASLTDQTAIEEWFVKFCGRPMPRSFIAETEVAPSAIALPDCDPEQCVRIVGGVLP